MRHFSYLNTAVRVLDAYQGNEPFAQALKKFFSLDKKYGSRDRKRISHLCYSYFRTGGIAQQLAREEAVLLGLFLCADGPDDTLASIKPEWNEKTGLPFQEKIRFAGYSFNPSDIFPAVGKLSDDIDAAEFALSHLRQPLLFLRARPGKESLVRRKLVDAGIAFEEISDATLALPNSAPIDSVLELNREAVVQDLSSQAVAGFFPTSFEGPVWDCCAASGGKSMLLHDHHSGIDLSVSDIRETILVNLRKRFREAGIMGYKSFVADLTVPNNTSPGAGYGLVMADVPCSGSGTWGRTPEQMYYYEEEKIDRYAALQKRIVDNVVPRIRKGGHLLYITCSVYREENEQAVQYIMQTHSLQKIKAGIIKGYDRRADTMFAAWLRRPL